MATTEYKFLKRLLKFRHMEFDVAFQQLTWAIVAPKKLYRQHETMYSLTSLLHEFCCYSVETRDQWARDDPAFLLCIAAFLAVSSLGYTLWLRLGVVGFLLALLWTVLVDLIGSGILVASILWLVTNKLLLKKQSRDPIEWGYCFDVHLNSFVPLSLFVFGVQMLLIHVLTIDMFVVMVVTDTLWMCALCSYIYSTFLGYSVTGRLKHTVVFLSGVLPLLLLYIISLALRINHSLWFATYYSWRTGNHSY